MIEHVIDYYLYRMEISKDISETKAFLRKVWEVKREGYNLTEAR